MATQGEIFEERISEFDDDLASEFSALLGVDAHQVLRRQDEEDHKLRMKMKLRKTPIEDHKRLHPDCEFLLGKDVGNIGKYDIRVRSPEKLRGSKARYQEGEARLESFENWPFYAHGTSPRVLSAAGFVFTSKRDTVQCFSCSGCLGNWEEGDDPWKEHAKWFPRCAFLRSKKSSKEIVQYIKSYKGFVHVTGEHFLNSWVRRELPMVSAKGATSGGFQKLENLDLSMNHKITEEGYRKFFQTLDNLPDLKVLSICRSLPEHIQVQATTVKALSQCVSRLPSLTRLEMLSWLLDEEDLRVINAMKERHPQSKHLTVFWKWIVPFSPVIQKKRCS